MVTGCRLQGCQSRKNVVLHCLCNTRKNIVLHYVCNQLSTMLIKDLKDLFLFNCSTAS